MTRNTWSLVHDDSVVEMIVFTIVNYENKKPTLIKSVNSIKL